MKKTKEEQKKITKKKTELNFYQKWWFWFIVGMIFIGSWVFLFIKDMNLRSSIIGICGVWGSTIATIFIGIIAYKQSERYKIENTRYEKSQDDRVWCQDKCTAINLYRERMNKAYLEFVDFSPIKTIEQYSQDIINNKFSLKLSIVASKLENMRSNIIMGMIMKEYYFKGEKELFDSYIKFKNLMNEAMDELKQILETETPNKLIALQKQYNSVLLAFTTHLAHVDKFISQVVLSGDRELLEAELKEREQEQLAWSLPMLEK